MSPRVPAAFEPAGKSPRRARSGLRHWAVRHAGFLSGFYRLCERVLMRLGPSLERLGLVARLERPVAFAERTIKGALFDCRMCGRCILSSTGLSCPMNCPKAMRNGPCGGVRADGGCEVYPEMTCVWVKAWEGAGRMPGGRAAIALVQPPLDHRQKGRSSWLAVLGGQHRAARGEG